MTSLLIYNFFANYPNLLEYLLIIISTYDLSKLCNRCNC